MSNSPIALAEEPLTFKLATEESELEQIHRLNYRTFVEEIPQHAPNGDGTLVDKFDRENTYIIGRRGNRVIGMLAVRGTRPFSLDAKLANLDSYLPANRTVCEVRLLAVEPDHRTGVVLAGLLGALNDVSVHAGFDLGVISAAVKQRKLYEHMGFVAFGPMVGTADAPFQPMYIKREVFEKHTENALRSRRANGDAGSTLRQSESFLPGPVNVHRDVWDAFNRTPVSHRHPDFGQDLQTTQRVLCDLVNSARVQLLVGSGTLANDAVAAQLTLLGMPGVVLTNGEFGERLVDHAERAGLVHTAVRAAWGDVLDLAKVQRAIAALPEGGWCWMAHCETSSGILNDLQRIREMCADRSIRLCVDCVSSIGTVPVDLSGVYLASCVSGKALGSLPGLSMVFYNHVIEPSGKLPRYLDLGYYADRGGVPFTHSSNLLAALRVAAERTAARAPFSEVAVLATWMRAWLRERSFPVLAPEDHAAPGIVTLAIKGVGNGAWLGDQMSDAGYELNYRSDYLRCRDWVQIALMGEFSRERVERLLATLEPAYARMPRDAS